MKIPKQRKYLASVAGRLGSQFVKRLDRDQLIDRTDHPVGKKDPKMTSVPSTLANAAKKNHANSVRRMKSNYAAKNVLKKLGL